jgi:hypothetical protein
MQLEFLKYGGKIICIFINVVYYRSIGHVNSDGLPNKEQTQLV